jgi:hypothetical protein
MKAGWEREVNSFTNFVDHEPRIDQGASPTSTGADSTMWPNDRPTPHD